MYNILRTNLIIIVTIFSFRNIWKIKNLNLESIKPT